MTRPAALLLAFLLAVPGAVRGEDAAVPGAALANVPLSVRQMGMAGVSLFGGDVMHGWSNPASLSGMGTRGMVSLGGGLLLDELSAFNFGGGWAFTEALSAGLLMTRYTSAMEELDALGDFTGREAGYYFTSAAVPVSFRWKHLAFGASFKFLREEWIDEKAATFGADFGLSADYLGARAMCSFRNFGGQFYRSEDSMDVVPWDAVGLAPEVRLGAGYTYAPLNASAGVEFSFIKERSMLFGIGTEWRPDPRFAVRLGLSVEPEARTAAQFTGGLSWDIRNIGLDYALFVHPVGVMHRMGLSYSFGRAGGRTEPVVREERRSEPEPVKVERKEGEKALNFAVADLTAQNVSSGDAAVIADLLRGELVKTGAFNVVEKGNMDKVLAEQGFQQTGCTSEECAVKIGKLLNVQRMAVGSFGKLMDSYIMSIRVVNVETGAIGFAESVEGGTVADLRRGLKDLAARMARQIR